MSSFKKKTGMLGRSPSPINPSSKRDNTVASHISLNSNSFSTALKEANEKNQNLMESLLNDKVFEPTPDDEVHRKLQQMDQSSSKQNPADQFGNLPKSNISKTNDNTSNSTNHGKHKSLAKETCGNKLLVLSLQKQSQFLQQEQSDLRKVNVQLVTINQNNANKIDQLLRKIAVLESVVDRPREISAGNDDFDDDPEFWRQNEELNLISLQNKSIMSKNKEALRKLNSDAIQIKQMLISMSQAQF
jgi:hypothetical protein